MKVNLKTNIDAYKGITDLWPFLSNIVPRVGEKIMIREKYIDQFGHKGLPIALEVVAVTYEDYNISVELYYSKGDLALRDKKILFGQ